MNNEELQKLRALAELVKSGDYSLNACNEFVEASGPDAILALIAKVESLAAEMETVLEAAEEWARYVEVDTAPVQLVIYLQLARDAHMAKEKAQ